MPSREVAPGHHGIENKPEIEPRQHILVTRDEATGVMTITIAPDDDDDSEGEDEYEDEDEDDLLEDGENKAVAGFGSSKSITGIYNSADTPRHDAEADSSGGNTSNETPSDYDPEFRSRPSTVPAVDLSPDTDGLPLGLERLVAAELGRPSFRAGCPAFEPALRALFRYFCDGACSLAQTGGHRQLDEAEPGSEPGVSLVSMRSMCTQLGITTGGFVTHADVEAMFQRICPPSRELTHLEHISGGASSRFEDERVHRLPGDAEGRPQDTDARLAYPKFVAGLVMLSVLLHDTARPGATGPRNRNLNSTGGDGGGSHGGLIAESVALGSL